MKITGAKQLQRGSLIVFEGCDRSGKTTQVKRLVDNLNKEGIESKMMRFPDRTTAIGSIINQYLTCTKELDDHAIHLLFSANRWELVPEIKASLDNGTTVIIDRYAFSGVAFSAAKPGLSLSWCKQPDVGLPRPDLVCFLDVSEDVAKARADFGGERYEKTEFQQEVRTNYSRLEDPTWKTVSADGTQEEVYTELYSLVKNCIEEEKKEIVPLWVEEGVKVGGKRARVDGDSGLDTNDEYSGVDTNDESEDGK